METFARDELPVLLEAGGAEIRAREAGEMAITFYRFAAGADFHSLMEGLPGDACQCPHWGYVIAGKLRIHTADGAHDVGTGEAFYVEPGHVPEALEDTEMFEVSPAAELREVGEQIARRIGTSLQAAGS